MNLLARFASLYSPRFPGGLVYIAQSSEYRIMPYLDWFWELPDFNRVQLRGRLDRTPIARLLLLIIKTGFWGQIILLGVLFIAGMISTPLLIAGLFLTPFIWAHLLCLPLFLGRVLIIKPQEFKALANAEKIFKNHKGKKIAVLGSYGKTTMKELLKTVLDNDLKVAATPANLNVARSIATFAGRLEGDEDVVIVEFGEEKPGDIAMFSKMFRPDYAIITGLAPAHLSHYKTIQAITEDLLSIADYVDVDKILYNHDSSLLKAHIGQKANGYSSEGLLGWSVSKVRLTQNATTFVLSKGKKQIKIKSGLLGRHQIGPLSAAAVLADILGLKPKQIEESIKLTKAFEHRMEPKEFNGAWLIDDTYNGNLEGVRVGLELLKTIKAKRKIYVTPGLVEQGEETDRVHQEIGRLIADSAPDVVVLMKNSVTDRIVEGLNRSGYKGKLQIEGNPLDFYGGLEHVLAKGDVIMMQNDWPDYYR